MADTLAVRDLQPGDVYVTDYERGARRLTSIRTLRAAHEYSVLEWVALDSNHKGHTEMLPGLPVQRLAMLETDLVINKVLTTEPGATVALYRAKSGEFYG